MRFGASSGRLQAAALIAALVLAHSPALAGPRDVELETDGLSPAKDCGSCHKEIHAKWSRGMHANAFIDPIFRTSFTKAYWETRGEAAAVCLSCHAPTIAVTGDVQARLPLTAEGVTCDFCHSLSDVDPGGGPERFKLELGVKHGPRPNLESPAHAIKQSPLFLSSRLCSGCHEWTNEKGAHLLSTYSEWAASPHAREGRTCQSCHMPSVEGRTVDPKVKQTAGRTINEHDLSGGHSVSQVKKALRVRIGSVKRDPDGMVSVQVSVDNVGSGHHVPTGLPTRSVALVVTATSSNRTVFNKEYVFRKEVVDETGRLLTDDAEVMLHGASIRMDNRIPAGQSAVQNLRFHADRDRDVVVSASVYYRYTPELLKDQLMEIRMSDAEEVVRPASGQLSRSTPSR